jgi:tetratricopeptide (TPR) repeat protein
MRVNGMSVWCAVLIAFMAVPVVAGAETVKSYYDLGVFAYEKGDYKTAQDFLEKAAEESPTDAYVKFYLGMTCAQLNKLPEAEIFFKRARTLDPNIPGLDYQMGIVSYKTGKYQDASGFFEKAVAENPSDALSVYYAGITAFMNEDYQKALGYLDKASQMSPSVKTNADYYAGISHYKMKEYDLAAEKLGYVSLNADTPSLKQDADMWLLVIRSEKEQAKPYSLYAKAGFQYDDNVTLGAVDSDIISDESDAAAIGYLSGRYAFVKQQQIDLGVGYSHYMTVYQDLTEYDLTGSMPEIYTEYRINPVTIGLSYIPSYYWVDGESYLMQHQVNPEIRWRIDDANEVTFAYSYYRNNYFTEGERDGHTNEVNVDFFHGLKNVSGYLFLRGTYMDNTASADDEYFIGAAGTIGVSYDILEKTNLFVYGTYFDKQYDHTDSTYKVKRDDSRYFASAAITQQVFYEWLGISLEYTYTNNNSNISDYEYNRNTISLYGVANF